MSLQSTPPHDSSLFPGIPRHLTVRTYAERTPSPQPHIRTAASISDSEPGPAGSGIEAASNRHAPAIFAFWSFAAGGASLAALQHVPASSVLLLNVTFWLAVVSSISLTEAWVKFRAPLLDRHVGVDAGRRVFMGQYAIESALALTSAGLLYTQASSASGAAAQLLAQHRPLAAAAAILAVELAFIFPALNLRGKHLIVENCSARPDKLSERQAAYVEELRGAIAGKPRPPPTMHLLSVALAFAKAGLLASAAWGLVVGLGAS